MGTFIILILIFGFIFYFIIKKGIHSYSSSYDSSSTHDHYSPENYLSGDSSSDSSGCDSSSND